MTTQRSETDDQQPTKTILCGHMDHRLRDLAVDYAREKNIPMSEVVAHMVAKAMKRQDLAPVPRLRKEVFRTPRVPSRLLKEKVELKGYVDSRLRDVVLAYADEQDLPLSEAVAHLIAKAMRRPDLAKVPRKRIGRPRRAEVSS